MQFNPALRSALLIRRYKRFLVDVQLPDGKFATMHCANTGAMLGCSTPGFKVYYSTSENLKRKLPNSIEMVETTSGDVICVNTIRANQVARDAIADQQIAELHAEEHLKTEAAIPDERGRFDFGNEHCFVEVKSVTFRHEGIGKFPDAKSERALKHVKALERRVQAGQRGVLLFVVMHTGIDHVTTAGEIDPMYQAAVRQAQDSGVEVVAYRCVVSPTELAISHKIPFLR